MKSPSPVELRDEDLLLRTLKLGDGEDVFQARQDEEIQRLGLSGHDRPQVRALDRH
jgi:hypothetical protein